MYDEEASWTSLHSTILAGNIDERLTGPTDSLFLSTLEEQSENSNLDDPEIEVIEDDIESAESLKAILTSDEDDYYDCSDKSVKYVFIFFLIPCRHILRVCEVLKNST